MNNKMIDEIMSLFIENNKKLDIIKKQYDKSKIEIEENDTGFVIKFNVLDSLINSSIEDIVLNNVYMDINDKEAGASCLLIIKGGKIETLEIFIYIGSLKPDIKQYKIFSAKRI